MLVVEDESDLARVVKRHVESLGCQVQVAASGEEALVLALPAREACTRKKTLM